MVSRLIAFIIIAVLPVMAAGQNRLGVDFSKPNSHEALIEKVESSSEKQFENLVTSFRNYLERNPDDVVAATELCRFIEYYNYSEDFYFNRAESYLEEAELYLTHQFKNEPLVELYFLDQLYGQQLESRAKALIKSEAIDWSNDQLSSIHLQLANHYSQRGEHSTAGFHALSAMDLNPTASAQLIAGNYFRLTEESQKGIDLLTKVYPGEMPHQKKSRMLLLSRLGADDKAIELLNQLRELKPAPFNPIEEAEVLIGNNEIDEAREVFESARNSYWDSTRLAKAHFKLEKRYGTAEQALSAYRFLRDQGFQKDPMLYHRLSLIFKHPKLPWQWRDCLGVLMILVFFGVLMLAPLTMLVPVHYWGLMRQRAGKLGLDWKPAWSMRHAWWTAGFFLTTTYIISYFFAYETVFPTFFTETTLELAQPSDEALVWMVLCSDFVMFCGLGLIAGFGKGWTAFRSDNKLPFYVVLLLAIAAFVLLKGVDIWARVLIDLFSNIFGEGFREFFSNIFASSGESYTSQSLQAVLKLMGPFMLIFTVAIITPVIEEVLFRGLLLTALVRHIPFWVANVLQAGFFTIVHEETQAYPFLFAFGLICGLLRKHTGSLLSCTLLHAINNLVAALFIIGWPQQALTWVDQTINGL